ncbi:hypothetical protein D3C76_1359370 [compost metagenome]
MVSCRQWLDKVQKDISMGRVQRPCLIIRRIPLLTVKALSISVIPTIMSSVKLRMEKYIPSQERERLAIKMDNPIPRSLTRRVDWQ